MTTDKLLVSGSTDAYDKAAGKWRHVWIWDERTGIQLVQSDIGITNTVFAAESFRTEEFTHFISSEIRGVKTRKYYTVTRKWQGISATRMALWKNYCAAVNQVLTEVW